MLSPEAKSAILHLQRRGARCHDIYELARIERALDEITRNPGNTAPSAFQVRSAMANASKILKNRRAVASITSLTERDLDVNYTDFGFVEVEFAYWIDTAHLSTKDRALLRRLAAEDDAAALAKAHGVSEQRMREIISRTRRRARTLYALSA